MHKLNQQVIVQSCLYQIASIRLRAHHKNFPEPDGDSDSQWQFIEMDTLVIDI